MLLATLALAGLLLALAAGLRGTFFQLLAEHWQRQLATMPETDAGILVQRAARVGEAGIPVLVEALASPRPGVAQAGSRALLDELSRWKTLPASESSPKLAILARALADRADRFSDDAQHDAAGLAGQILLWPLDESKADRARVIACCQRVLKATRDERLPPAWTPLAAEGEGGPQAGDEAAPDPPAGGVNERLSDADPRNTGIPLPGMPGLPGGGLPSELAEPELLPLDGVAARLAAARAERGPVSQQGDAKGPGRLNTELDAGPLEGSPEAAHGRGPSLHPLAYLRSAMGAPEAEPAEPIESDCLDGVETFDVMKALANSKPAQAEEARRELERRGFTAVHFEIARQMLDRDPAMRIRLARRLPTLTSIDAAPWLLRLSEDPDPGVRQAAIGILATSGDAELLSQLERLASRDPAPCVQRLAGEIAKRRRKSPR